MAAMDLLSSKLLRSSLHLPSPFLPSPPLPSRRRRPSAIHCRLTTSSPSTTTTTTTSDSSEEEANQDLSSLLSTSSDDSAAAAGKKKRSSSGASSIPSGVRLENISKSYKGVTVLKDVSWEVQRGEKVGLVGVNGAGKTTQLRIIAGLEEPDGGNVVKAKENMKIAFLSQEFEVCASRTVREEFLSAFQEEMDVKRRLERVQAALAGATEDMDLMGRLLDELDLLQRRSQDVDLDMVEVKIQKLMPDLGFAPEDADRLVASFSGGWQMRMSLGKILLQDPDLLLLDEPTNHVDLDTIEWLEGYLKTQEVPMVIISHDRAFLDQLCTKIVETEFGVSKTYKGNYSEYVLAKAIWVETQYAAWEKQQKEIEQTKELINRLGAGVNSGRASSEQKKLEKLEKEGLIEKPFQRKQLKIRFPERGRSGRTVLTIKNLQFGFGDGTLFNNANLLVERGEKIAVIGPNGCGKSTLLKIILGMEKPQGGEVLLGEHNVLPNYFEQNQAEALDLEKTVLATVADAAEDWTIDDIKGLLGRCNFRDDMLDRKVQFLSGGEKARLAFCKFLVTPSTLLILDEPTNHLDIPSKEMLEEAISEYTGTVITVSHDRYFIKQIVNRVIEVKDQTIQDYQGDYNTTLLNHILTSQHGKRIAVIENEFGEVDIDSSLVASHSSVAEDIVMVNNGCLCCTVRGDLVKMLLKLVKQKGDKFDHIVIETTGLAKPGPVIETFCSDELVSRYVKLAGVVTMVDCKHAMKHLNEVKARWVVNEAVEQVAYADRIILNKIDLVDDAELEALINKIKLINGMAHMKKTKFGDVDMDFVLGIGGYDLDRIEAEVQLHERNDTDHCHAGDEHGHHHDHAHDSAVSSVSIVSEGVLDLDEVNDWLERLVDEKGEDLYRLKGVISVNESTGRFVFQGVHSMLEGCPAKPWEPDEKRINKLVFIGRNLDEAALRKAFKGCLL